jgi:YVTN family beta-propeller protein
MRYAALGLACTLFFADGHRTARGQDPGPTRAASGAQAPRGGGEVAYLVLHKAGSALGFYDRSGQLIATIPVGSHPHEMVLAPDGRHVYITDNGVMLLTDSGEGGNTVSIVDVAKRERVGVIDLGRFRRPHGIALDPHSGRLLVTTELPDRLLVLDPSSRRVIHDYDPSGRTPHMVTLGPGGRVAFVSNSGSGQVAAIDLRGGETTVIPTGESPQGGVLTPDGRRMYVTSRDGASIAILDPAGRRKVGEIRTGPGPNRIAITPDGRLLVYSLGKGSAVGIADAATGEVVGRVPLEGAIVSLSLSPDGSRAFASAQELDRVYIISVPDRKLIGTIRTPRGAGPDPVLELAR